ncbi:chloramphenicol acetyltransferase [Chryseobacterium formosense]|uniref:Chloramphenicol acetyltransferase n=1 Tax=Chryseobacterium formosense TaxID=236814 RepID=A0A085Z9J9_9FLAO|nr:chloramphenicol acetyltransferase [Chryseobacterium formosense]KFF01113.1 chloramphenicol acetyltransferase [Chryseobacterium formosense]SFT42441.1 chloramphenicol O-acetyltransferase type A [Chryseobacterium formosense]
MKIIDIESWNRKEHFEFFSKMKSPYFGFTTEVDCTKAYENAKEKKYSFFSYYLYKSMVAINTVDELKLRMVDDQIILFDEVHVGSTIGREDGTFGFSFFEYSEDFEKFNEGLQNQINIVQNSKGLGISNDVLPINHIRHTTIPWSSFTTILHPTNFDPKECIPKIAFGKFSIKDGRKMMPVSIEAHHGLADGLHLAKYFEEFQKQLDLP